MATSTLDPNCSVKLNEDIFEIVLPLALDVTHDRVLEPKLPRLLAYADYFNLTAALVRVSHRAFWQVQRILYEHERVAWLSHHHCENLLDSLYIDKKELSEQHAHVPDTLKQDIHHYEQLRTRASSGWDWPRSINRGLDKVVFTNEEKKPVGSWVREVGSVIQRQDLDSDEEDDDSTDTFD